MRKFLLYFFYEKCLLAHRLVLVTMQTGTSDINGSLGERYWVCDCLLDSNVY